MKKWVLILLTLALFILTACGNNDGQEAQTGGQVETEKEVTVEEADEAPRETEENVSENEQTNESQSPEQSEESSSNEENHTAAEQCIMTQLTECENIPTADQFQAYNDLVADGTLPQAPGSGCLSCGVKYSFEAKYGESNPINSLVLPRSEDSPEDIKDVIQFVRQYLFALPAYFNNENEEALNFYQPESNGYNTIVENKASGSFNNHMTYSVHIDSEEINADGSTNIYAYRTYSHTNTDGIFEAYTRYNVIETNGRYYLTEYEELENIRIE